MKARIKSTEEIVEVLPYAKNLYLELSDKSSRLFRYDEVDNPNDSESYDYWIKLEHQYAGMAMQGMLNNSLLITSLLKVNKSHEDIVDEVTSTAIRYAHALVEKMKEERK